MTAEAQLACRAAPTAQKTALPKVGFILSQFPEVHETFILREFVALEREGLDFVIMSLKPCRDRVIQREAAAFLDRTYYPWDAPRVASVRTAMRTLADCRHLVPWTRQPARSAYVAWAAGRLAALCAELGVAHLHAHWATAPTSAAALMAAMLDVDYSFTAHAWDIFAGDGRLARKARRARFIVTCTAANVEAIRAVVAAEDAEKVLLNYHGIPCSAGRGALPPAAGALRVAAVGRLVETKGFEHLIDAVASADFPVELTIVGEGPLAGRLRRRASKARRPVRFAGLVPNEEVFEILSSADVFAMPSVIAANGDRDGIPNVMLEAMAVGLPVVASAISGIPEAVIDGGSGILVPPADPAALEAALRRIWLGRDEARRMGREGARLVHERFSAEANAAALFDIFRERLGERAG